MTRTETDPAVAGLLDSVELAEDLVYRGQVAALPQRASAARRARSERSSGVESVAALFFLAQLRCWHRAPQNACRVFFGLNLSPHSEHLRGRRDVPLLFLA